MGEDVCSAANVQFLGTSGVALAIGTRFATLPVAFELPGAKSGRIGTKGLADLDDFHGLRCDGKVGANEHAVTGSAVVIGAEVAGMRQGRRVGEVAGNGLRCSRTVCPDKGVLRLRRRTRRVAFAQDDTL